MPSIPAQKSPLFLTTSQRKALVHLEKIAAMRGQHIDVGGIRPRWNPFLVGPSGSGKTALVRRFVEIWNGKNLDKPALHLLSISVGSWVVFGAKTEPHTLTTVREFLRQHPDAVIMMDELDKAAREEVALREPWYAGVFTEILMLLDGDSRLKIHGWTDTDIESLGQTMIVGGGAWQRVARRLQSRTIGFGTGSSNSETYSSLIFSDLGLPDEIMYRFHPDLIEIEPPDNQSFAEGIQIIYSALGVAISDDRRRDLAREATHSKIGFRWLETHLSNLLLEHPSASKNLSVKPAPKDEVTKKLYISVDDLGRRLHAYAMRGRRLATEMDVIAVRCTAICQNEEIASMKKVFASRLAFLAEGLAQAAEAWRAYECATTREERAKADIRVESELQNIDVFIWGTIHMDLATLLAWGLAEDITRLRSEIRSMLAQRTFLVGVAPA